MVLPLVGIFTLRPSSVSPAASHLPPRGKALVRWNLVGAGGNPRGRRGHTPALRTGALLLPKLLSRIEPGDLLGWWSAARVTVLPLTAAARPKTSVHHPVTNRVTPQWCRFTTRVAGSNCQRPLAALPKLLSRIEPGDLLGWWSAARVTVLPLTAAARPKTSVHHPVTNRVTPQWCRFTTRVAGSNCQRPLAARRPCLSLWERWHGASRDGEGFSVYHHVTNRVTPNGVGSPPGIQARIVSGHWPQFFA